MMDLNAFFPAPQKLNPFRVVHLVGCNQREHAVLATEAASVCVFRMQQVAVEWRRSKPGRVATFDGRASLLLYYSDGKLAAEYYIDVVPGPGIDEPGQPVRKAKASK